MPIPVSLTEIRTDAVFLYASSICVRITLIVLSGYENLVAFEIRLIKICYTRSPSVIRKELWPPV